MIGCMKGASTSQLVLYTDSAGAIKIDVRFEDETVWLTQKLMAELFGVDVRTINEHLQNIFEEKELLENSVVRKFRITASDNKAYDTKHYELTAILAVGYRVRSSRGTTFRQWATARLSEYVVKGFTVDDERLKNLGGDGYWKELLARIRDIRSSEKVFYRQILDIYATSVDYAADAETSFAFFKKVQNKVHFAVHGQTAAEVIYSRADAEKDFMGLTTFTGAKPHLKDVTVAKNYLNEKELRALGQIVSGYLDFAERQAEREMPMKMVDWAQHLDSILTSTGEKILKGSGSISHEQAIDKATNEYTKYQQKTLSDVEKSYLDSVVGIEKKVRK
jgi:hypothetical protein